VGAALVAASSPEVVVLLEAKSESIGDELSLGVETDEAEVLSSLD